MSAANIKRILTLFFCLLVWACLALFKNGTSLGISRDEAVPAQTVQTTQPDTSSIIVDQAQGYAGPVPVCIHITAGRIDSIEVLENIETPPFLERATAAILPAYRGQTIDEALTAKVDAVSGATYSSNALLTNIHQGLLQAGQTAQPEAESTWTWDWDWKLAAALLVALLAAILPLFIKNKTYRLVQLCLNIGVLGFYAGTFVNLTNLTSLMSYGLHWNQLALAVLLVVALLYPLFGKRGHYCTWCCPLGSAQELMGRLNPKHKWVLNERQRKFAQYIQDSLFVLLCLLTLSGVAFDWMSYELFSAFLWDSAEWALLAFGALTAVLSIFVNRPYCRFICPTGCLLSKL